VLLRLSYAKYTQIVSQAALYLVAEDANKPTTNLLRRTYEELHKDEEEAFRASKTSTYVR
jgi:hypothetical protein